MNSYHPIIENSQELSNSFKANTILSSRAIRLSLLPWLYDHRENLTMYLGRKIKCWMLFGKFQNRKEEATHRTEHRCNTNLLSQTVYNIEIENYISFGEQEYREYFESRCGLWIIKCNFVNCNSATPFSG